jgi:hypothetical protein
MEVIGADGVHIGTVDKIDGGRIKLTKKDSGEGSIRAIITSSIKASSPGLKETRSDSLRTQTWQSRWSRKSKRTLTQRGAGNPAPVRSSRTKQSPIQN